METTATILHADLDAFYASVEQLLDPSLRGKPIAVGGGVVLAASYEARAFGVRGGMPGRRARELCPQLIFVGGHFKDYQRLGDAAIKVINDFTPLVERISIDEAFADVAGCTHLFGPPAEIASAIRRRVRAELGLPISVGVARTKHLAKIASQVAKPDGLVVVDPDTELEFLHDLPVELMWGVGPVTKARLADIGVLTIGQLAKTPGWSLKELLGPAAGDKLTALAWNRDPKRNQDASSGAIGRSAVGARQEACRRANFPTHAASSCRQDRQPAPRQIPARSDRDGPRSLRRPPFGHALRNARRADFGDRDACRDRRGVGAHGPCASPDEKTISLLAISVSHLEERPQVQLELPLGLEDEKRRPGTKRGMARWVADRAVDAIRDASDGRRSDTGRSHWEYPVPFPTRFANSPKRTCDLLGNRERYRYPNDRVNAAPLRLAEPSPVVFICNTRAWGFGGCVRLPACAVRLTMIPEASAVWVRRCHRAAFERRDAA